VKASREISGTVTRWDRPTWTPLLDLVGFDLVGWFMWMFELELADGGRVHAYKHIATRRYFHLAEDGRAFQYTARGRYVPIERGEAIDEAVDGWEQLLSPDEDPELVRDALERAREGYPRRMITRVWRGWTAAENADAYARFLLTELFPSMADIPGFRGAEVLRRPDGEEVAFVTVTRFESLDAIRAFAGEAYERPALEPQALALLARYDERAQHYDTASYPG
jgi:heme-degrading monooxygenase HmoA